MTHAKPQQMPRLVNRKAPMDFTAALVLLARMGIDLHRVELLAAGDHENYRGEIYSQKPEPGATLSPDTRIALEVGFRGAVDQMPYQFFYGLRRRADDGRDWDRRARELMAPFDASVVRYHGLIEHHILRLALSYYDQTQVSRQLAVYGLPQPRVPLDEREQMLMVSLLPRYNEWAGNADALVDVLELFFGFACRIVENIPASVRHAGAPPVPARPACRRTRTPDASRRRLCRKRLYLPRCGVRP